MTTTFLPKGYESLKTEKPYLNLSKLTEGEYKIRIVQQPICGWLDWIDKKPFRYLPDDKPTAFDPEKPVRAFWAMHVWSYEKKGLYIMEVTQSGIIKFLTILGADEDWGDFTQYDIKLKKMGSGKDTTYSITPLPHKALPNEAIEAIAHTKINLNALYMGKDPWTDLDVVVATQGIDSSVPEKHSFEELEELLVSDGISVAHLEEYVKGIEKHTKQTQKEVVTAIFLPGMLTKFKETYCNWLLKRSDQTKVAV